MIDWFFAMLIRVETAYPEWFLIFDTRSRSKSSDWTDETHPGNDWLGPIAKKPAKRAAEDVPGYFGLVLTDS